MLLDLSQPVLNVSECVPSCYIVNQQCPSSPPVKLSRDALELLLSSCIVDLQLDISLFTRVLLSVILKLDHPRSKIDSDSQIVLGTESFVCELHQEAGLAHRGISNDNVFEEEGVGHFLVRVYYS